ncbi:single-stranded DNA-binding protein [Nocardioides sp. KIGAM211]|uniref:Single-stranded DNA-binding protein n=1 Tax=Nocardioides luti TaxID=2761101 RepID=A0A7X0V9K4_9ACTN|nr:single-stranded DNA-binding protein [Nocardioides luti]MBB6626759.1 single-stranded DNA-binding protein [Nocardioides luti]
MNDTTVTLQGWLGSNVTLRRAGASDVPVASFRLACTPRRYHRATDTWSDGETQWYTVTAWRGLATNCDRSLRRGDAVVVHGRLDATTWKNRDGEPVFTLEVEATFVGHDLNRGTTTFVRPPRPAAAAEPVRDPDRVADAEAAA